VRGGALHRRGAGAGGVPIVLLKGRPIAGGLPPAAGRLFNDIDIMVPRARLDASRPPLGRGWRAGKIDAMTTVLPA